MQNDEKVEIGYTLPKERRMEAAKNLGDFGDVLAARIRETGEKEAADELMADIILACAALHHVAAFATDKCRFVPLSGENGG